jgi:hypothetical protein
MKLKWRVDPPPTGRYRSFAHRGWPTANFSGADKIAVQIRCDDPYIPAKVKTGDHKPLCVYIAEWFDPAERGTRAAFEWRKLTTEFATLKEAKAAAYQALKERPKFWPEGVE